MIFECSAIIVVILVMSYLIFRSGSGYGWGIGVLPLTLVPAAHIVGPQLSLVLIQLLRIEYLTARIGVDICALMITCLLLGAISSRMKNKRSRWAYLVVCGGFSAILTCVLLVRTVVG
jgi:hypothetical protein